MTDEKGQASVDEVAQGLDLAADVFEIVPVGIRFTGPAGTFERTGEREFVMVDGEWTAWVEAFSDRLSLRKFRLIDRRPATDAMKSGLASAGLVYHVSSDT